MITLSDREHEMLSSLANREEMTSSGTVSWLVRREHERYRRPPLGAEIVVEECQGTSGVRVRRTTKRA